MEECLTTLQKRFPLAVATYKREDHAVQLLEKFGMVHFFDAICGSDAAATKTKSQIVEKAMNLVDATSAESLLVGDSANDAESAAHLIAVHTQQQRDEDHAQ